MTSEVEKILEEALRLPDDQRAALADALSESLDLGELSAEWLNEIRQRVERIERGEAKLVDLGEHLAQLRSQFR